MRSIHNIGLTIVLASMLAIGAATNNVVGAALVEEGIQAASVGADVGCRFASGFETLHDLIPVTVGDCVENESHNNVAGDGLQRTIKGLLVWRKADNFTAFTDGARTWVNGPQGLQERANGERFAWEGLERLKNAEFRLPIGNIRAEKGVTFTMTGGRWDYASPPERANAVLLLDQFGVGDFSGDGVADYVALVGANTGGSGVFTYAVPFMESEGRVVQVGEAESLGDRIKINGVDVRSDGVYAVDMITQGPNEPMCCGTLRVVREYKVRWMEQGLRLRAMNAIYTLPVGLAPTSPQTAMTFSNGAWERGGIPGQRAASAVMTDKVAIGDLNGDGALDVVAPVWVNAGGSGIFEFAVPLVQKDGKLIQAGAEFLGDRIKINSITIKGSGTYVVDMIVQGPNEPMCCPSQAAVREYKAAV